MKWNDASTAESEVEESASPPAETSYLHEGCCSEFVSPLFTDLDTFRCRSEGSCCVTGCITKVIDDRDSPEPVEKIHVVDKAVDKVSEKLTAREQSLTSGG